jgi:diaminopimelate decarboxylase
MATTSSTITRSSLDAAVVKRLVAAHGSPLFVYSLSELEQRAEKLLGLDLPFGLTVRYAIKANPHPEIARLLAGKGLHFDASSSYEADFLLKEGIPADHISLSSQQPAHNLPELLGSGVRYVATSLHQLELFAATARPGSKVALRVNAGLGSGHSNRTVTAGPSASFGLWHEHLDQALELAAKHKLVIDRLHTHIGAGADPAVWAQAIDVSLGIVERMPDVTTLDMGGGYKVHRFGSEAETNMTEVAAAFSDRLRAFANRTGRQLHLEVEPGTWLAARSGSLVAEVTDIVDTGPQGYTFLRINTGMNDILRPSLYGAQHEIRVLNDSSEQADYVVVGHNCESGDILTPGPGDPEHIEPRRLNKAAIGDLLVIEDTGAYCASMRAAGYNAFPSAAEILTD